MSADPRRRPAPAAQSAPPPPPPPPPPAEAQPDSSVQALDGANDQDTPQQPKGEESFKLRFCTVCASNNNRYVDCSHVVTRVSLFSTSVPALSRRPMSSLALPPSLHKRIYSPKYKANAFPSRLLPCRRHDTSSRSIAVLIR